MLKEFTGGKRMKNLKRGTGCLCHICIFLLASTLISSCGKSTLEKWKEQYDLGQQYLLEENYEEAIVAFTAAIEIEPNQADAYIGRGNAYVLSGETEEHLAQALADYQYVLELDEANAEAYLGIADIYIRQGDYEAALDILEEGMEKTEGNEEISAKIAEIESGNITDSSGNARRISSYDSSGVLMWYHEYTYDADGKQTSVTSYDTSGNQTGYVELTYDENGRELVSYTYFSSGDGSVGKRVLEYLSEDIVKEEFYTSEGVRYQFYNTKYNSDGNIIYQECFGENGELFEAVQCEYNAQQQIIKSIIEGSDGQLKSYHTYEYDRYGNTIRRNCYTADGILTYYRVDDYDENGRYLGYKEFDGEGNLERSVSTE